jgi:hypothetical protein
MPVQRYPKEVIVQRGDELFEQTIRSQIAGRPDMDFVVIDIETGDFEVGPVEIEATGRLWDRHPEAQIFTRRVGSRSAHRIGFVPRRNPPKSARS